jgi:hypothetical protein
MIEEYNLEPKEKNVNKNREKVSPKKNNTYSTCNVKTKLCLFNPLVLRLDEMMVLWNYRLMEQMNGCKKGRSA